MHTDPHYPCLNCGERQFVIKLKPHSLYGEFQGGRVEPSSEVKAIDFVSAYPAEHLVCLKMVGGMPCVRRAKHPGDCDTGDVSELRGQLKEKAAYRAVDNLRVDAMEENKKLWKEVVEQQGVIRSKFVLLNDTKQDRRERHDLIVQQAEMLNRFETELTNLRERLKEASTCLAEHPAYPGAGCQFKRGHEYAKDGTAISHHRNGGITWPTSSDDVVKEKVELLRRLEYFHTFLNQTFHLPYLQSDEAVLTEVHKMVESYNAGMEELTKLKNGVQALIAKFTSKE